jgi:hypothetical protein
MVRYDHIGEQRIWVEALTQTSSNLFVQMTRDCLTTTNNHIPFLCQRGYAVSPQFQCAKECRHKIMLKCIKKQDDMSQHHFTCSIARKY